MLTENNIMHENGEFWVLDDRKVYHVCKSGITHSVTVCQFARTADGLSLAIAYCDYKARR